MEAKKMIKDRNLSTVNKDEFRLRAHYDRHSMRILSEDDWQSWVNNGYVVIKKAVDPTLVSNLEKLAWEFEGIDKNNRDTWYPEYKKNLRNNELSFNAGMIEVYNHQYLWDTRQTQRIYDSFVDLWGNEKLWVTIDRMNFNLPPEPGFVFKSFMHWDYDPDSSVDNVQGVLSVSDQTDESAGGFICIPELFNDYQEWRLKQSNDWDWYKPDVESLKKTFVPLEKGDLLIFNSKLCHGIKQNVSKDKVRIAQYISMMPAQSLDLQLKEWRVSLWKDQKSPSGYSFHGDERNIEKKHYQQAKLTDLGRKLLGLDPW
ncbi:phytanoyl-CoA dioxygenase family protein [Enterobacter asburiae]|uniref:phytanoyl-CoA dioxygenase family protein n=1 Tax=Enterobacter asburiae TaxID=61645 RepID=UPI00192A92D8|nr:phytanoyl-CoA dioxygenase family protein [Enterobacter asburiae]MBL5841305.1 phytanoyl-CoA dioxygenase family protein [Enterobacter asburiae]MBL5914246.1 phytanoyl-CoA dioxygenase family protein [Enterobacter asburiae]MBL5918552.1 phytanoyl-CoA dioxygenase family protein [Enterobacter asburiae]MBL5941699.1 phytanoyl-CoA dioxygenase family protein [Enterobacter asburiae]MBL5963619.1 phytanoyl-CoA dioxygenase family protein [Enterobacter asburiae]